MIGLCDRMRDHNFCTCNFQINIILHMHVKLHGKYSNYVATVARTYCWSSACIPLGKGRLSRKVKFTGLWPRTPDPGPGPRSAPRSAPTMCHIRILTYTRVLHALRFHGNGVTFDSALFTTSFVIQVTYLQLFAVFRRLKLSSSPV